MKRFENYAVVFPARDAFYKGLSPTFYNNYDFFKDIMDTASDYIGYDLCEISYKNPVLNPELHTVCLVAHCYAVYKLVVRHVKGPIAAAGFSQGEFTAVASAGSMQFPQVLKLIYELEQLVITNDSIKDGMMARVMELDRNKLMECCRIVDPEETSVVLATYLSRDQNVISGSKVKVAEVARLAKKSGARWVIPLDTAAFHSPLCLNMAAESTPIFGRYNFSDSEYPVYSCVDGEGAVKGNQIKEKLSKQLAAPILWDRIVGNFKSLGIDGILELGAGCTVSGNIRIIDESIKCQWINTAEDLEKMIDASIRC
ncbi:ACP S-malonyltransferase [Pelosinus baikalensis]|uniref:[acyl-carrier-protein] S-malonyltransferase n=1 Tax=Pelosinus baikalensis TaxID=2892015 RepID=A0ABS8HTL5_9FIRM|nr:hypothetical protein [Pelosinus baikalensis]MCC5466521.1 hypothetical protein [Pelosinus baikalensis]